MGEMITSPPIHPSDGSTNSQIEGGVVMGEIITSPAIHPSDGSTNSQIGGGGGNGRNHYFTTHPSQ